MLIIGGMGISQTGSQQALKQLPPSVTLAFAPYGNSLLRWMQEARRKGHELLLQVPMEPFGGDTPGPHTLSTAQDAATNLADLHWSMSRITNYVGIVNFLGGKFVTEPAAMKPVFEDIARRGLLFVDDGSIRNSIAGEVAKSALLPFARAAVQIDATTEPRRHGQSAECAGRGGQADRHRHRHGQCVPQIGGRHREIRGRSKCRRHRDHSGFGDRRRS